MNDKKRQEYADSLYAGIHTLSCKSDLLIDYIMPDVASGIKSYSHKKVRNQAKIQTYMQLNVNKYVNADNTIITKHSQFAEALEEIMNGCGITTNDINITRCDLAINSDDLEHYERYRKLNKLLICCLAECYSFRNCYQTYNLWNYNSLNVAIKNDSYEIENYNKDIESDGKNVVKNRLELRSKRLEDSDLTYEFIVKWKSKLNKSIKYFDKVQKHYNAELSKLYLEDLQKPKNQRKYISVNAFIMQYSDCIFTSRQLIDLLAQMNVPDAEQKAKNYKKYHKIEYYSMRDLEFIVSAINDKIADYFNA